MFRKLLLAAVFSTLASSAFAVCSQIPLNIKDASSNTVAMSSGSAADGNCKTYIDADTASALYGAINSGVATPGSAVPATALWGAINIGGTARGWTGVNPTGAVYAGATDNTSWNGVALGSPSNFGTSPGAVASPGVNASLFYGTVAAVGDPCALNVATYKPISITTATTTNIITGTAAKKIYICQIVLSSAAADNVAIIEGTTGATCGAGTAAVWGGTTAANGFNFPANGGVSIGNGASFVAQTATNNNDICIITSAATPLAGGIKYVVQ
jgi:hypothetical protein